MIIDEGDYLAHYGILRKSGRYPWGSGATQEERNRTFLGMVDELKKQKLSDTEIAKALGINTAQLRDAKSIAKNAEKQSKISMAQKLRDKGYSNVAIGKRMGIGESSVRDLLKPGSADKAHILDTTANFLKDQVGQKKYIDIGKGVEYHMGVSAGNLKKSVAKLTDEGYTVHYVNVDQLGTGHKTRLKVLAAPDTPYREVLSNRSEIRLPVGYSSTGGRSYNEILPPLSVSSKRVAVRYADQGGTAADGVIFVRPGVASVSLGGAHYAQVRIAVDGTRYLKGMAMYKDDLPPGVDLMFNTNKKNTGNKLDAMKPMSDDPDSPFGASISRQIGTVGASGKVEKLTSAMNIVNEAGNWGEWSKNLSSQMLSKQTNTLAKEQLGKYREGKQKEFDEIMRCDNPVVKKRLLMSYADDVDAAAVHLKAAALPRQATHVILPIESMKESEVYAPNYRDGERVVLVRYPHGGKFEIPELTVNNRNPEAKRILGRAPDAIGIHSKVAERLSGADFDGDTVLVIPNNEGKVKTAPPLEGLKGFDPQSAFPGYEGMPKMSAHTKGVQMGKITNLIADMTVRGATNDELARAVRHSMVVIDAEKHGLDWKRSAAENGIPALTKKYQNNNGRVGGASTIFSRASADIQVDDRKTRIDPETGRKIHEYSGVTYTKTTEGKRGKVTEKVVVKKSPVKSTRLAETEDAHTLTSGTPIEKVYADHSNELKAMANLARKEALATRNLTYSQSARQAYKPQVERLEAALELALRNSPLERQAQLVANAVVAQKLAANPDMEKADIKKLKNRELLNARNRVGAKKQSIEISPAEWAAIQAGAITTNKLNEIIANSDLEKLKALATPKEHEAFPANLKARAEAMSRSNYTQAEIAAALGVTVSTLKRGLKPDVSG